MNPPPFFFLLRHELSPSHKKRSGARDLVELGQASTHLGMVGIYTVLVWLLPECRVVELLLRGDYKSRKQRVTVEKHKSGSQSHSCVCVCLSPQISPQRTEHIYAYRLMASRAPPHNNIHNSFRRAAPLQR